MIIKGKVIGVVQAINKVDGYFSEDDKNSFEAFASQAAIAIENSRLFNRVKDEKNKLENIFRVIGEGVVVSDEEGAIKIINEAGIRYFDYNPNMHKTVKDILKGFLADADIETLLKERKNFKFTVEKKEQKKLILECNFLTDRFASKEGREFLWIFNDVTQKVMESMVAREFLSLVSHKFKTPITSMVGYSQVLEQMEGGNEIIKKSVKSIVSQGFKLSSLVDEMIEFSAIENKSVCDLKFSCVKSSEIIDSIISQKKNKYPEAEFERAVIDVFDMKIDVELFYKVLSELIKNGIKHNKKDKKKIVIASKILNGDRTISVWDNGNGIAGEDLERIFDKFYQIEPGFTGQTDGWGLGLNIVKKILELHGFGYKIKSHPGRDTLFTITMGRV